jgi:iron(III) transport system substrate-binding protein
MSRRGFFRTGAGLLAVGASALASAGCGPTPTPPTPEEEAAFATGKVLWYSSAPQSVLDETAKVFNDMHPTLTLHGLHSRGSELAQKVEAEVASGKTRASIVMLPNPSILYDWRDRAILLEHHSPEEAYFPDWFKEPGWWIGARVLDIQMICNTDLEPEPLTSWEALADPKYKGMLALTDGAAITTSVLLYKQLKAKYGPDFWPSVVENQPTIHSGTARLLDAVVSGEAILGDNLGYQPLLVLEKKNPDAPVRPTWPSPTPIMYAANAILSSAPNPEGAIEAYDWLASAEGQQALVNSNLCLSAREDVDRGELAPKFSEMTWEAYDYQEFAAEVEGLHAEWKEVFGRE